MILILQASSPGVGESGMIYEICTYNVKENRLDEFEVLARELREYYRACEGVREAAYIRQACAAPEGAVTYVLYLVCSEGADTNPRSCTPEIRTAFFALHHGRSLCGCRRSLAIVIAVLSVGKE